MRTMTGFRKMRAGLLGVWSSPMRRIPVAILTCVAATSANALARHHAHKQPAWAMSVLLRIDPSDLLFEVDAATATVVPPSPYPKILHVYGRHFLRGSRIRANGVPLKTEYRSSTELRASVRDVESQLNTDSDNSRLRYTNITVTTPGARRKTTRAIRFTHFTEGNAGG